jgi:hypothetical protein
MDLRGKCDLTLADARQDWWKVQDYDARAGGLEPLPQRPILTEDGDRLPLPPVERRHQVAESDFTAAEHADVVDERDS